MSTKKIVNETTKVMSHEFIKKLYKATENKRNDK